MLSNGRCIGSAGRLSGADMENAYSGMQQQWTDKTGILPAAWDLREKLLLLAPETPQSDGRSCRSVWILRLSLHCFGPFNRYDRSDKSPEFLYCLRLYRSPSWDRRPCRSCEAAVWQSF